MVFGDHVQMTRLYIRHEITDMMTYYKGIFKVMVAIIRFFAMILPFGVEFLTFYAMACKYSFCSTFNCLINFM